MSIILGLFIVAGVAFILASINVTEEREKPRREAKWRQKRP